MHEFILGDLMPFAFEFVAADGPEPAAFYVMIAVVLALFIMMTAMATLIFKCLKIAPTGHAIVRNGVDGTTVSFDRKIVIPGLHQFELVNISVQRLRYQRQDDESLVFADQKRVNVVADLMLRINKDSEDVKRATSALGTERINDLEKLRDHFSSGFNESLEVAAAGMTSGDFLKNRERFRELLIPNFGIDHNGMVVDDIAIHHAERVR